MRLLIDGVAFQINKPDIARIWRTLVPHLARCSELDVIILDRGAAPHFAGVEMVPFPSYTLDKHMAADSLLIEKMCRHLGVDAFTSTYYTTPLSIPMLLVVYSMIPELLELNSKGRAQMEKELAISFAQRYVCISESARRDLLAVYPEIAYEATSVALCGFDEQVFRKRDEEDVTDFRRRFYLDRSYYLFMGSCTMGYEWGRRLFFEAVSGLPEVDFDVLCLGGDDEMDDEMPRVLSMGIRCHRAQLSDEDLSRAFNGAIALVIPFSCEGYFPVMEAMACHCAIITTRHGCLAEIAGEAACLFSGSSVDEMREALLKVRDPSCRESLKRAGRERVKRFAWDTMASTIVDSIHALHKEAQAGRFDAFFQNWRRVREIQGSVDY